MATAASPALVLPRYIAIKGDNGMYLALKSSGLLTFDAPQITRLATHEVLYNADDPNATFIIRSQNQHFWRRDASNWIRANSNAGSPPAATESAARFKLANLESGKLGFRSAVDDLYLNRLDRQAVYGYNGLEEVPNQWSKVEVSDAWEHAISLPRFIFIQGDNGMYMHTANIGNIQWLKFHGSDPANLYGTSEVINLLDGSLAFYSPQTLRCWRNNTNWIWTDSSRNDMLTNKRCHFEPIRLSRTMLALRNKFNNQICKPFTDYWESSLNAAAVSTMDVTTHLTVSEAVSGRQLFDVKYLLNLAATTEQVPLAVAYGSAVNNSSYMTDMRVGVTISQSVSTSYTFSISFTFSQTVSTEFKAGIPFLADGRVEVQIGFEQSFSNQWDQTTSKGLEFNKEYTVKDVPPGGMASVQIICSTAKMRIPFTYKCTESAPDRPTQEFVDDIFEGVDAYHTEAVISNSTSTYATAIKPVDTFSL